MSYKTKMFKFIYNICLKFTIFHRISIKRRKDGKVRQFLRPN